MSQVFKDGKDTIIFATKEDHQTPSKVELSPPEPSPGLIFPDGSINWNCPCLGGMATGPCGVEFRESFTCFHYSKEDPKGMECREKFTAMWDCMDQYPEVYKDGLKDDEDIKNPEEPTGETDNNQQVEVQSKEKNS
ncbi:mitochondrial intermembrane space import and assembly protein 40-B-like [Sipha flava]|jgi:intermembrane space import and assembly protein 40|uniref:Mitochondrial intermembrane space import and assembly protein 40 n=1 Tax=Sipha flava TaxID=143950 RepID=A0A2S2QJ51_9HEMI|nr:mitochondrial intermembrane space import and assembly protein 40-B-like [Sipha flava]